MINLCKIFSLPRVVEELPIRPLGWVVFLTSFEFGMLFNILLCWVILMYLHVINSKSILDCSFIMRVVIVMFICTQDNKPLGINFCMSDVKNCNMDDLPAILHHDDNLKQAKRLLQAWKR